MFLLCLLQTTNSLAQSYLLQLHGVDISDDKINQLVKPEGEFADQPSAIGYIQKLLPVLQAQGYLTSSVDSIGITGNQYHAYVFVGQQYKWAKLSFKDIPPAFIVAVGINSTQYDDRAILPNALSKLSERILIWTENNGYPFAKLWLDSLVIAKDGGVSANLRLDKGAFRKIDSVIIAGDAEISKNYILHYIGIHEGEAYSEQKLKNISNRLRELLFLQEERPWAIKFAMSDTRLSLFLKDRPANQLNAVIGLQPNSQQTGKLLLTLDGVVALQNALGYGESFSITAQKLQYRSVTIKADAAWPYLFNTPVGADGHFDLYNKDTTFSRSSFQIGGRYQLSANDHFRVFYENRSNRNTTVDVASVQASRRLPDNIDATANGGGAEFVVNRTDYRLNPRKGWQARLSGNALVRKTKRSDQVLGIRDGSGFDYSKLYDSLQESSNQYRVSGEAAYYLPVGGKAAFKAMYGGGYISGQKLFLNELYQVGGFKLLRGFDEESIFTNHYHVISFELRFLLSSTSNVYLFSDNGWVQSKFNASNTSSIYNGFGVGTSLQTKSGIFTIAYALGRSDNIELQLRQSKIHFGYVAFF